MVRRQNQIRGCLLGGAAGDAMGFCLNEMSMEDIGEKYGPLGLRGYDTINGFAAISSNTQLALFTANGLLFGATRGAMRGIMAPYVNYLQVFYLDWLRTQQFSNRKLPGRPFAWLCCVQELYARRSPDPAVLYALEAEVPGTLEEPVNRSRGPAGLARCLSIGLFLDPTVTDRSEIALLGAESAALTQGDPAGFLPAALLCDLLNRIIFDKPDHFRVLLKESIHAIRQQFIVRFRHVTQLEERLARAIDLASDSRPPREAIRLLNPTDAIGVLAAACYVCLKYPGDFDQAIVAAVNHGGDSAAAGAVAGALMGSMLGAEAIPDFYLDPLELREIIQELADDVFQGCPMSKDGLLFDDLWDQKYVQRTYL